MMVAFYAESACARDEGVLKVVVGTEVSILC